MKNAIQIQGYLYSIVLKETIEYRYCPYKFEKTDSKSLRKVLILCFNITIIFVWFVIIVFFAWGGFFHQPISLVAICFVLLIIILICSGIFYYQINTVSDYFYSHSMRARMQVIRWKNSNLPRKCKLDIDEFIDTENLRCADLKHPASITNIYDYFNKKNETYLDEACTSFANALIVLATKGVVNIICKNNFVSTEMASFVFVSQDYLFCKTYIPDSNLESNGDLEILLLENIDVCSQENKDILQLISDVYKTEKTIPSEWLLESILINNLEEKRWLSDIVI